MREEARALRAWLKVRGSFPGPIFLSKQKRPIDRTTLHLLMKKYGAAAGIPAKLRHFHVLKHCCATHLLSKGFGVERVQDWIGHANIQSTLVRCSSGPFGEILPLARIERGERFDVIFCNFMIPISL